MGNKDCCWSANFKDIWTEIYVGVLNKIMTPPPLQEKENTMCECVLYMFACCLYLCECVCVLCLHACMCCVCLCFLCVLCKFLYVVYVCVCTQCMLVCMFVYAVHVFMLPKFVCMRALHLCVCI